MMKLIVYLAGSLLSVLLALLHPLFCIPALCFVVLLFREGSIHLYNSRHDPLTRLPNLLQLNHFRKSYTKAKKLTVIYIDVDDLKQINDTNGHKAGNAALIEIATFLQQFCCKTETAYRIGGDEFLLISSTDNIQERFLSAKTQLQHIGISFGIAIGSGNRLDDLLHTAEQNMYSMKKM